MIDVRPVLDRRSRRQFVDLPYKFHSGRPTWIPPARVTEAPLFDRARNPFYAVADMEIFLAYDGDRVVGRIAAIDDHRHNEFRHENLAAFGFFEAASPDAAAALFEHVDRWARERGRTAIRGPISPSLNYVAGLQIDAFDTEPYIMMAWNPPEYVEYLEAAGYRKVKDLWCWLLEVDRLPFDRLAKLAARIQARHRITVRSVSLRRIRQEADALYSVYCDAWEHNWGFVPPTRDEFWNIVKDLRLIQMRDGISIAEVDGRPVACTTVVPDVNQVLKGTNGRFLPFLWLRLLRMTRIVTRARWMTAGIVSEYRDKGIFPILGLEFVKIAKRYGFKEAECSWILEDNQPTNQLLRNVGATKYKTYRLYEKPVPAAVERLCP